MSPLEEKEEKHKYTCNMCHGTGRSPYDNLPEEAGIKDDTCYNCNGEGGYDHCLCSAYCSCECMCGAWDDVECTCWDDYENYGEEDGEEE